MSDIREKIEHELEELQAEASHQKQQEPKNSLEQYCDDNPEAAECRIYED